MVGRGCVRDGGVRSDNRKVLGGNNIDDSLAVNHFLKVLNPMTQLVLVTLKGSAILGNQDR